MGFANGAVPSPAATPTKRETNHGTDEPGKKRRHIYHPPSSLDPPIKRSRRQPSLSPLDDTSASQLRQHLRDVRREAFLQPLIALVTRLMFHRANHGLFNEPVDPVRWNIPHYRDVIKKPMDLSLVKHKCLTLQYASAEDCAADIRLVFANACLFNPPGHVVHDAAKTLRKEFDREFARLQNKWNAQRKRRNDHSCAHCLANVCAVCDEKCINLEPPFVLCSGPCRQRIKRYSVCYRSPDETHHWCAKCYLSLPKLLTPPPTSAISRQGEQDPSDLLSTSKPKLLKSELVKVKFMDELTEPWVQCDRCNHWVHQICALFNDAVDQDQSYICPLCRLCDLEAVENKPTGKWDSAQLSPSSSTDVGDVLRKKSGNGALSPTVKHTAFTKEFGRCFDVQERVLEFLDAKERAHVVPSRGDNLITSEQLQTTALSKFIQESVRSLLMKEDEVETAHSITVRVVSNVRTTATVSPVVRQQFCSKQRQYPPSVSYTSKAICAFQRIAGLEVCIFSMYVQEYDDDCVIESNRNRVYIAYIDSLVYMRPRRVRTRVFQEILIAYLAFSKARGFIKAHIWACPTTRGGDFIYWCHPPFQKNPGKERLVMWYQRMVSEAKRRNVVYACEDLFETEFHDLERSIQQRLPPYFDGDYWPLEVERLASLPMKRGKQTEEELQGAHFREKLVESVQLGRESLFAISLQPQCTTCGRVLMNEECRRLKTDERNDVFYCHDCSSLTEKQNMAVESPPSYLDSISEKDRWENAELSSPFVDHRPEMLKKCEEHHYQFDSFRRAKYSTTMLVYQIFASQQRGK